MQQILLKIADSAGVSFKLGDIVAPGISALRSADVSSDIISLSGITLNIASPGILDEDATLGEENLSELLFNAAPDGMNRRDAEFLAAIIFDYALEVAPRIDGQVNLIDVAALSAHTNYMRDTFGDISVEPEFIQRIGQFAQMHINLQDLEARNEPASNGEAG
jgi:hypothetical protein